jgi:hypothetical protein
MVANIKMGRSRHANLPMEGVWRSEAQYWYVQISNLLYCEGCQFGAKGSPAYLPVPVPAPVACLLTPTHRSSVVGYPSREVLTVQTSE